MVTHSCDVLAFLNAPKNCLLINLKKAVPESSCFPPPWPGLAASLLERVMGLIVNLLIRIVCHCFLANWYLRCFLLFSSGISAVF